MLAGGRLASEADMARTKEFSFGGVGGSLGWTDETGRPAWTYLTTSFYHTIPSNNHTIPSNNTKFSIVHCVQNPFLSGKTRNSKIFSRGTLSIVRDRLPSGWSVGAGEGGVSGVCGSH